MESWQASARFADRTTAGRALATALHELRGQDPVVLGLPRGGVPVAFQVARALAAPLDVILVRKLGAPLQPELAMGAIGEDGARVLSQGVVSTLGVDEDEWRQVERRERTELEHQARRLRAIRPRQPLTGHTAIIVDDGIATGSTAAAACQVARAHGADRTVLAVPVAPPQAIRRLAGVADRVVILVTPQPFYAVGQWYEDFAPVSDAEVRQLLDPKNGGDDPTFRTEP